MDSNCISGSCEFHTLTPEKLILTLEGITGGGGGQSDPPRFFWP